MALYAFTHTHTHTMHEKTLLISKDAQALDRRLAHLRVPGVGRAPVVVAEDRGGQGLEQDG